jgi:hypothetical protein
MALYQNCPGGQADGVVIFLQYYVDHGTLHLRIKTWIIAVKSKSELRAGTSQHR